MEDENIKKDNIVPVYVNYYGNNFDEDDKKFIAQYNNFSNNCFGDLYERYNIDPAYVYKMLNPKQLNKLKNNFDYKSRFNEILFSEKSNVDYDQLVLLYEVFCWNILYKKMLADELSKQEENNIEQDKRNKFLKQQNEIMKTAFYKNLFDELVYHLVEYKNDEDVIKFLWEKTFGSLNDGNNKDKFIELEKEILDCVKQVYEKEHPIICIANADNVDVAKNKDKYNEYTFVQWKKWDSLPEFEKAYEKKLPDVKLDDVLSVGDDKIFGKEEIKSIKDDESQETKKLLTQQIDDYLDEKDAEYKNFFTLIDYYLDFCSKDRNCQAYSANRELFIAKKYYLWRLISSHLKVIFQNDKRDDFMNKFNDKFIKKGYIENENEAEKAAIVDIIELSSTVQYGRIMTYDGDRYKLNDNEIYKNLLDNSQSDCLDWLGGDLFPKHWVDLIKNELEYKNLCKEIIFKKDTSALDAKDLSLIFEVFLFNVLYKKISNINLSKDNDEIREDLQNIWDEKIENSILNQGLFEKFRRNIVNFKDKDDVIKFLYKETFYVIGEVADNNKVFDTMKNEILKCVEALKDNKSPLIFFTDNKFVKEKYSSYTYKPCIFVWERKDNLPELRKKTTMSLKENIKDVLCAFDDYIFDDINSQKDKEDIELPIENKNTVINDDIENKSMDYLLLSESIGDYLNELNLDSDDETAFNKNENDNDNSQLTPEQKVDNNFLELIEYCCSFCAKEQKLLAEDKNNGRRRLFEAKKEYLLQCIKQQSKDYDKNRIKEFMIMFCSKFIENHKIKANNEAEKKEIANFIDWLDRQGIYPQDSAYFVVLGDKIYPTSIKYTKIVQNLDIFFDIDLDKCTVKLKDEEFRSAIYNVLNKSHTIDRTELFKNLYERVMKDEKMNSDQKKECLNKIMPQLLKFISIYGLLDETIMNDDPKYVCYRLDYDRVNELTDSEPKVNDYYFQKLKSDVSLGKAYYYNDGNGNLNHLKRLNAIKDMVNDKKLTLRGNNVEVIKLLIEHFVTHSLDIKNVADFIKKKYLRAVFEKTDVNDIKESEEFKILTLAFEIVSRLVGDDKEHEVKQFFDDEIKKLFGLDGLQNSLLDFIKPISKFKAIKFCLNEDKNKDDVINKFVDNFKDTMEATKTSGNLNSIEKVFTETKPDFDLAMSICERIFDEATTYTTKPSYKFCEMDNQRRPPWEFMIELFSILLSNDNFKLDSEEKQKRVYVLYLKIIDFGYSTKSENEIKKIQNQIKAKVYDESGFNLLKGYSGIKHDYNAKELMTELPKFKNWVYIVSSDKDFFKGFIAEIVFHIESGDYKGNEFDKNKFYDIYSIKSLAGYKSFQNGGLYFSQLSKFDKQKQREFIFDTDLFLKIRNGCLDGCLNANASLHKFLFQSDFTFVLPIDEITADKVNNAFAQYSQKLHKNFENKEGAEYQKLKDDFFGLFAKSLIGHCELILSDEQYHKGKNKDELKDDYIKTIATFCRDKETKIIRSVLENCTRTAEEQKNKFIKPYAIIEALLNDENFKLDADKAKLMINWFSKYNVDELGIELKENETYDNLGVINKLFEKIENDSIELEQDKYTSLLRGKIRFMQVLPGEQCGYEVLRVNDVDSENSNEYKMIKSIAKKIFDRLEQQQKNINKIQVAQNNILATTNTNTVIAMNDNERISTAEKVFDVEQQQKILVPFEPKARIFQKIQTRQMTEKRRSIKKLRPLLKIIKWISFALITIAGLILILNSFIHMFSLSLFLSITLILVCIICDMALFENGRKILKTLLYCIFCCNTETDGNIGKNNYYQKDKSSIFDNQNKITGNDNDIKLIESNQFEKNDD